jgi:hypothetical protein
MSKVLHATYLDGNLVLDEKLDAALEGQKLTLILVEDSKELDQPQQTEVEHDERKRRFLEESKQYSAKLPPDYKFDREEAHKR